MRHLAQDRQRRIRLLMDRQMIASAAEIPEDAIPVDPTCSTKAMIWSAEVYYRDVEFRCSDCGKAEIWTAVSQQYYFEVMRSSPYKLAKRCYECRQKRIPLRDASRANAAAKRQRTGAVDEDRKHDAGA